MIEIRPREIVILAEDFDRLVAWYRDVLVFDVVRLFDDQFHILQSRDVHGHPAGDRPGVGDGRGAR